MKNKKKTKSKSILLVISFVLVAVFIIWITFKNVKEPTPDLNCEQSDIVDVRVEAFDREYINSPVKDFYIDEKRISVFYWDKICRDLLNVRLNETLIKSKNLWLDARSWYQTDEVELFCKYNIYWGEEGDFYGKTLESGEEFFNTTDVLIAQEKRPLKYNESLIHAEWREDIGDTRLVNNNPDYDVILKLKLNQTIEVC